MSDNRPDSDRHVYNHDADSGDNSGVAAIVKAFVKNPGGAVQIIAFIGGLYGVYYAMQTKIDDVRAAQTVNYDHLNAKLDQLTNNDADERIKIDNIFTRGDTRYAAIITKLSAHDVDIARIVAGLDFIVDQYKNHEAHDSERAPAVPPRVYLTPTSPVP